MKRAIAALAAAGLALGMAGTFGASVATASVHPHSGVFTLTITQSVGLSTTGTTSETFTFSNGTPSGTVEYGFCNDDASLPNPLVKPGACTADAFASLDATGAGTAVETFTPGQQGTSKLSGCPMSSTQKGLGVACIAAAADLGSGATADVPLYFGTPVGKVAGTKGVKGEATLSSMGPFATAGLDVAVDPPTTTCQAFSKKAPKGDVGWTAAPLCSDGSVAGLPAGEGFATGEPVVVLENGTAICNPTLAPGAPGACPYATADSGGADIKNPGSVSVDLLTTYGITLPNSSTTQFTLYGGSSTVTANMCVTVSKKGVVTGTNGPCA